MTFDCHEIRTSFKSAKKVGAGDGNRTHATSLEGWDSTIELHPHSSTLVYSIKIHFRSQTISTIIPQFFPKNSIEKTCVFFIFFV